MGKADTGLCRESQVIRNSCIPFRAIRLNLLKFSEMTWLLRGSPAVCHRQQTNVMSISTGRKGMYRILGRMDYTLADGRKWVCTRISLSSGIQAWGIQTL